MGVAGVVVSREARGVVAGPVGVTWMSEKADAVDMGRDMDVETMDNRDGLPDARTSSSLGLERLVCFMPRAFFCWRWIDAR